MSNLILSDLVFGTLTLLITFAGVISFLDYVDTEPQEEAFTVSYESSLTTRTLLRMQIEGRPLYEWIAAETPEEELLSLIQSKIQPLTLPGEAWLIWMSEPYILYEGQILRQGNSGSIGRGEFTAGVDDIITSHRTTPRIAIRTQQGVQPVLITHITPQQLQDTMTGTNGQFTRAALRGKR